MNEVDLNAQKNNDKNRLKTIIIDSSILNNHQSQSLADLLSQSSVFVKDYGPGMVATPGFRGTADDQTKTFWNGIPLNSSMYGIQDLNLVPVFLLDGVDINYGGASLLNGSGGFGGSLNLKSDSKSEPYQAEIISTVGSFGEIKNCLGIDYGSSKIWGGTKVYDESANNNFPYINTFQWGNPAEIEKDAATHQYGALQSFGWQISDKDILTANGWYQYSYRHLPQTMISDLNHEYQVDESVRTDVQFRHYENNYNWGIDGLYANEYLFYHNELDGINEPSTNQRYELKADINPAFKIPFHLNAGIEEIQEVANIKEYEGVKQRNRTGAWVDAGYDISKKWQVGLIARTEAIDFKSVQPAFTASASFKALKKEELNLHINGGHNYNYPNLNDLYWYPGGNPNLQPEHSWFGEAGASSEIDMCHQNTLHSDITLFSNWIDNYILWTPVSGSIWQAENLKKVWARGIEASVSFDHKTSVSDILVKASYQYTPSTDQSLVSAYDQTLGEQLIYIPTQSAQAFCNVSYKKYSFTAEYTYTGSRNTTDIPLPGYSLVNVFTGRAFLYHKIHFNLAARCYNLFNESYQAIIWRPMPGRWYEISLKVDLWK